MKKLCVPVIFLLWIPLAASFADQPSQVVSVNEEDAPARVYTQPGGPYIAEINERASFRVQEVRGDWLKISFEGWVEKFSTDWKKGPPVAAPVKEEVSAITLAYFTIGKMSKRQTGDLARVKLTLSVKNNTGKLVKSWKGLLTVKHRSTGVLFKSPITSGKRAIEPHSTNNVFFYWTEQEKEYSDLLSYPKESLEVSLSKTKVVD